MARARSPEKRKAILEAAVQEIAQSGLSAPTAKIAKGAGVAEGTLFTYFATKEELLNQLYLELKGEVYVRVNADFPEKGDLRSRAFHIWSSYLDWSIQHPLKRKVSVQLGLCDIISPETRACAAAGRENIDSTLRELGKRTAVLGLPPDFAAAAMSSMQEAAMDLVAKQPRQRKILIERIFEAFWRIFS
jgi:AcrR family transcriptional regulator